MSGLDDNPKVCCTAAQCPTGQTAGESAVCYRSTCPEGKNPLTSGVRAIKNTLPTPREPREGAPSPLRCLDLTARQGKPVSSHSADAGFASSNALSCGPAMRNETERGNAQERRRPEQQAPSGTHAHGRRASPLLPRCTKEARARGGALMRRYRAQAPADKHAGRARRLRNPLIRSSLHACGDHRDACRSTNYANYPSLSRIVSRGRYRKPVPRVPKPLKKAR